MGEEQKNLVYLSDKIGSEYQSWNKDALVIIKAPTGCGKSHFILNELLNYAMQQGRTNSLFSESDNFKGSAYKEV